MKKLFLTAGIAALAAGSVASASTMSMSTRSLHIDPLSLHIDPLSLHIDPLSLHIDPLSLHIDPLSLHIDPLQRALGTSFFDANSLHIDPLSLHIDPLSLHIDPLSLHIDPLSLHIDPLSLHIDPLSLHIDPLSLHIDPLALGFMAMQWDSLSGSEEMLTGQADFFWGTFDPLSLHIDPLSLHIDPLSLHIDPLSLHIDPLSLHIDPLSLHIDPLSLHIDPLSLHIDPLSLHIDPLSLHIDPLSLHIDPLSLHIDPLSLHIDPLSLHIDPLSLHIDPLAVQLQALSLHIDALSLHIDPLSLHIDPLSLHIDPLVLSALVELGLTESMSFERLSLHIDPLMSLVGLADELDALAAQLGDMDLAELSLHIDPLKFAEIEALVGSLGGIEGLSAQLRSIGETATALNGAYTEYSSLYAAAEDRYGALIEAETGAGFTDGFLAGFLEKHGLSGDGFSGFLAMNEAERTAFLIDLNDQLYTFLGVDHPDYWMSAVNWSPRLSEIAGYGEGVTIGFVDQAFAGNGAVSSAELIHGQVFDDQAHGLAVTGAAAGALDGDGVMGVAPEASVLVANPFDAAGAADEFAVMDAISALGRSGASIINLSLGESGAVFADGWKDVFRDGQVKRSTKDALFVMAAGNDGLVQSDDVRMGGTRGAVDRLILVGALDPSGEIANFSNTPGDACFISRGTCTPMMERFLVAPGQQILVATEDGVSRASGTSFAAPLVSGAAALLQSRWEWLSDNPEETAEILFRTADDLGDPGVDAVYGWGRLNVSASQRPIDVNALTFRTRGGEVSILDAGLSPELMARVNRRATVTAFESIGSTFRDFEIPVGVLEAEAFDPAVTRETAVEQYFGNRVGATTGQTQSVAGLSFSGTGHFTDASPKDSLVMGGEDFGWSLTLEAREPAHGLIVPEGGVAFETHGKLTADRAGMTLAFGHGDGALAFSGSSFAMTSDHDVLTGGVNPMLGLASGGGYVRAAFELSERFTLSGGISARDDADLVVNPFSGVLDERIAGTEGYRATAANAAVAYQLMEGTSLSFGLTALNEEEGFLGGQSVGALSFGETAESRSMTVSMESALGRGLTLALSATAGRTTGSANDDGILAIGQDGVTTTAYQAALTKSGFLGKTDHIRFSFAQPLNIESGALETRSYGVVDRATGELGFLPSVIGLGNAERRYVAEVLYGRPVLSDRASLSVFSQWDSQPLLTPEESAVSTGLRFTIGF
ncbi:S8 family serine peptidase [Parvularcula sp. ZS-1/3]|uniref:S8 family serine peptidase n=1 Tax=Parvularcula mediterranea TaxID=2732508 RepID=A0A7Y3W420_9PROT|nr:S8 family peptidase [Parvularcula mediterranea]NNU14721.1 S8 family serine peptidase [Parvularcula mediterranea]